MSQHKGPCSTAPSRLLLTHQRQSSGLALDRSLPSSPESKHHVQSAEQHEHWHTGISQQSTYSVLVHGDERVDSSTGFVRVASTAALTAGVASTRQNTCVGGVGGIDDVAAPWSRQSRGHRDNV
jgi:hypothetical protein